MNHPGISGGSTGERNGRFRSPVTRTGRRGQLTLALTGSSSLASRADTWQWYRLPPPAPKGRYTSARSEDRQLPGRGPIGQGYTSSARPVAPGKVVALGDGRRPGLAAASGQAPRYARCATITARSMSSCRQNRRLPGPRSSAPGCVRCLGCRGQVPPGGRAAGWRDPQHFHRARTGSVPFCTSDPHACAHIAGQPSSYQAGSQQQITRRGPCDAPAPDARTGCRQG